MIDALRMSDRYNSPGLRFSVLQPAPVGFGPEVNLFPKNDSCPGPGTFVNSTGRSKMARNHSVFRVFGPVTLLPGRATHLAPGGSPARGIPRRRTTRSHARSGRPDPDRARRDPDRVEGRDPADGRPRSIPPPFEADRDGIAIHLVRGH